MSHLTVNEKLCTRCNICSSVCIMSIIGKANSSTLPIVSDENSAKCFRCGHCQAFCPSGALTLNFPVEEMPAQLSAAEKIDQKELAVYFKKRRSIRDYKNQPVPRELISEVLETARYAATGGNTQLVQWLVISNRTDIRRIAELTVDWMRSIQNTGNPLAPYLVSVIDFWDQGKDMICYNAPHLLAAHLPAENPTGDITDAVIALTHFDLAAPAFGLGTCWNGFITMAAAEYAPLQSALAIPAERKLAYTMLFGYPAYQPVNLPPRNPLVVEWR